MVHTISFNWFNYIKAVFGSRICRGTCRWGQKRSGTLLQCRGKDNVVKQLAFVSPLRIPLEIQDTNPASRILLVIQILAGYYFSKWYRKIPFFHKISIKGARNTRSTSFGDLETTISSCRTINSNSYAPQPPYPFVDLEESSNVQLSQILTASICFSTSNVVLNNLTAPMTDK